MAKAEPVSDQNWQIASKIRTTQELFNYLSRAYVAQVALPAEKVHVVEYFEKP